MDSLADELHLLNNVIHDGRQYLVANCCIHSLQNQLSNGVKEALGDGGLGNINAMQLIHTVWDLQESLPLEEWRHMLMRSSEFVHSHRDQGDNDDNENYAQFLVNFNEVSAFHSSFKRDVPDPSAKCEGTILAKMLAPILTRWWTVGSAASCAFDYYLQLFHAAQTIINVYSSVSRANKIASALCSLMLDQENFIDLCLIRSFHKRCVNKHLDCYNRRTI